jgi:hypothetical protein
VAVVFKLFGWPVEENIKYNDLACFYKKKHLRIPKLVPKAASEFFSGLLPLSLLGGGRYDMNERPQMQGGKQQSL